MSRKITKEIGFELGRLRFEIDDFAVVDVYADEPIKPVLIDLGDLNWNQIGDLGEILTDAYNDHESKKAAEKSEHDEEIPND